MGQSMGRWLSGWHIECSCISMKHLGEKLDIHCGGVDNIFPHHTNEIAQSESYLGHKWCNYWFHVNHLVTKQGKMSKSKEVSLRYLLLWKKATIQWCIVCSACCLITANHWNFQRIF